MKQKVKQEDKFYWWKKHKDDVPFYRWIQGKDPSTPKIMLAPEECWTNVDHDIYRTHNFIHILHGAYDYSDYKKVLPEDIVKKIVIWPTYFAHWSMSRAITFTYNKPNEQEYKSLFVCLNHKPRPHRVRFIDDLAKFDLLDKNFYSWHGDPYGDNLEVELKYWKEEKVILDVLNQNTSPVQNFWPKEMDLSVINLVTETFDAGPFVTEKTFRCFLYKKPFIIYGPPGIHHKLLEWGFKLPKKIINYSFDLIEDHAKRREAICKELQRLSKKDFNILAKKLKPTTEYNLQIFYRLIKNKKIIPQIALEDSYYAQEIQQSIDNIDRLTKSNFAP